MIELNLLEKKQPFKVPPILGMDLSEINVKMLVIALFIFYIPEIFVHEYFDGKIKTEDEVLQKLTSEIERTNNENSKNANIKEQLDAYNKQVEKLKSRSTQVDEILKIRTNPKKVLEKIARSLPEDVWFDQLTINENKEVNITGGAESPRSIGELLTLLNDSPFFGNSLMPTKQENKQETVEGIVTNFELFELKGKIKNYDMRTR